MSLSGNSALSQAWLGAIDEATECLRQQQHRGSSYQESLARSREYLALLESHLRKRKESKWDLSPHRSPPPFAATTQSIDASPAQSTSNGAVRLPKNNYRDSSNPFSTFSQDVDSDDSDGSDDDDDDDAGDLPVLNVPTDNMSQRRLLIRVLTSKSEVFAGLASQLRHSQEWTMGATQLTYSLDCIHNALILADSEISRWLATGREAKDLIVDADIVQVSIESLTKNRDDYEKAAQKIMASLLRKLAPQWQSRDSVKANMGEDRWKNNPAPKMNYARMREEAEKQLKDVKGALKYLDAVNIGDLEASSKILQARLKKPASTSSSHRYNGLRPTDLSRRVSFDDYPDATMWGWTFTGSKGVTEFFEKDGVKLDWYFTTATVKTSLDHPTQGKTQLFAAKVDPQTYAQILSNPRHHTGVRYHRK